MMSTKKNKGVETMYERKIGALKKKLVTYDGHTLTIGKKTQIAKNEIQTIFYKEPTLTESGSIYFSKNGESTPVNFSDVTRLTLYFNRKYQGAVEELLNVLDLPVETDTKATTNVKSKNKKIIKCPNCSSSDVAFMGNNKKSFSTGKAVAGGLLTGGIGTLAGFAGKKGKTDRWHCTNCGNVFESKSK